MAGFSKGLSTSGITCFWKSELCPGLKWSKAFGNCAPLVAVERSESCMAIKSNVLPGGVGPSYPAGFLVSISWFVCTFCFILTVFCRIRQIIELAKMLVTNTIFFFLLMSFLQTHISKSLLVRAGWTLHTNVFQLAECWWIICRD